MSIDEVDKLKLNNDEVDKKKNAWGKQKELVFRRGSWLIHHYTPYISSENVYILTLCSQW